jgi:oligopeptide transport system substrate-binding protein
MSFFFDTNVDHLKEMDKSKGNKNSVVLSNVNFRKAFSLAINRAEYVTATEGYKPAFSLMNSLYYYDFYNDPASSYRNTEQAMEAICNLYGVKWGSGTPYATLKEAHDSITGYNLTEAKALMKTACDELVKAGLYTAGQEIKIKIGWAKGALTSADNQQLTLMNKFINAAIEGSGFGKVTFEAVGNIADRYGDVAKGEYAVGYGAWGGAALYPFRNFQVYFDPDQYDINEAACWDPKTEKLELTVKGEKVTMTWQEWGNSMIGTGKYANADFETKLDITSMLETKFLEKYYRIPLAGTTICSMLSYQFNYYTDEYNMAYGFGGSRIMTATYDDYEWNKFVAKQGGNVDYE